MGGKQQLTKIMDKMAANIAIQEQQAGKPRSSRELDIQAEEAFMGAIYGIVECTDINVVNKLSRYVNRDTGCTVFNNQNYYVDDRPSIIRMKRKLHLIGNIYR